MAERFADRRAAALARRAAAQPDAVRALLQARVAALQASAAPTPAAATPAPPGAGRAALSALLQHIATQRAGVATSSAASTAAEMRRTWVRLNAERRLAQSRAALPRNAGPLNSQHLMHRALALMRELSPAYFERFVAHADTLLWLERWPPQALAGDGAARTRNRRPR